MTLQLAIAGTLRERLAALKRASQGRQQQQALAPGGVAAEQLEQQLKELQNNALDISDLYNAYAQPHELWDVCLEICDFAGEQQCCASQPAEPAENCRVVMLLGVVGLKNTAGWLYVVRMVNAATI